MNLGDKKTAQKLLKKSLTIKHIKKEIKIEKLGPKEE